MVSSAALLSPARGGEGGDLITKICKKNLSFILTGSNDEKVLKNSFLQVSGFSAISSKAQISSCATAASPLCARSMLG